MYYSLLETPVMGSVRFRTEPNRTEPDRFRFDLNFLKNETVRFGSVRNFFGSIRFGLKKIYIIFYNFFFSSGTFFLCICMSYLPIHVYTSNLPIHYVCTSNLSIHYTCMASIILKKNKTTQV